MNGMNTKDKIVLDISDSEELTEYFSRKAPGDPCRIKKIDATLDENTDGTVVLSIEDIDIDGTAEDEPDATDDEAGDTYAEEDASAAVKLFKGRKAKKSAPKPNVGEELEA